MKPVKISIFVACLAAILTVGGLAAWAVGEVYKDQDTSSIQITSQADGLDVDMTEVQYIRSYLGEYSKQILLKVKSEHKTSTNLEGTTSVTTIEARSQKDFYATPLWSVTDNSNRVNYLNEDFIAAEVFGCCGDFDRAKIYNIETGKSPATFFDDDFFSATVPNSGLGNRYFAQIEDKQAPAKKGVEDFVGTIGYFTVDGRMAMVRFYIKITPGWTTALTDINLVNLAGKKSKNTVEGKEIQLWDHDGEKSADLAFKDFGLTGKVSFDNKNYVFTIPINGDKIDAAAIKTTKGLSFEVIQ